MTNTRRNLLARNTHAEEQYGEQVQIEQQQEYHLRNDARSCISGHDDIGIGYYLWYDFSLLEAPRCRGGCQSRSSLLTGRFISDYGCGRRRRCCGCGCGGGGAAAAAAGAGGAGDAGGGGGGGGVG